MLALRRFRNLVCLVPLLEKILSVDLVSHYFPRKCLILTDFAERLLEREPLLVQRFLPEVEPTMLSPAIEPRSPTPGPVNDLRYLAAAPRDDPLDGGICGLVVANSDATTLQPLLDPRQFFARGVEVVLPLPLEGRVRFGHEGREAKCDTTASGKLREDVFDLVDELGQFLEVFFGFRRMPDHEVELDARPTGCHRLLDGGENILLGDTLVDDVPESLAAGLRSKRESRLTDATHALRQADAERVRAQRRQADSDTSTDERAAHPVGEFHRL